VPRSRSLIIALIGVAASGCGAQTAGRDSTPTPGPTTSTASRPSPSPSPSLPQAHPQAIQPVAGAAAAAVPPPGTQAGVSVGPPSRSLPQPFSDAQIREQLAQSGMTASTNQATLTAGGLAVVPIGAPAAVQEVIAAGNTIARLPYRYGGGHATYEDTAYDCSGSISYVFAAAHLLDHTVASGALENWGAAGPGKWITVFANAGHTFMYVAGLRFDTVALAETGSRWSNRSASESLSSFSVRHPVGL
jgi:cell wall-associated NlpC family hydrolase